MSLRRGVGVAGLLALTACGSIGLPDATHSLGWVDGTPTRFAAGRGAMHLRWSQRIVPIYDDAYLPVEQATPALDPLHDRVYVGSTTGTLWALRGNGRRVYRYDAGAAFEAGPVVDPDTQELYAATEDGVVHALAAGRGTLRWKVDSGAGATREPVLLVPDALYVVSDTDQVVALSRSNGEILWRYKREPTTDYHVTGHAGLILVDGRLFAAFSDGMVAALDAGDGHVIWERDTALDFPPGEVGRGQRFVDVDTTPVWVGSLLYVASFSGGLYGLDPASGTVSTHRPELTGITSIVAVGSDLVLAKADGRLERLDAETAASRWSRRISRGTPGHPVLVNDVLYLSESKGGFIAVSVASGAELSRIESGHGFTASAAFGPRRGFVISNGGTLYAFATPDE